MSHRQSTIANFLGSAQGNIQKNSTTGARIAAKLGSNRVSISWINRLGEDIVVRAEGPNHLRTFAVLSGRSEVLALPREDASTSWFWYRQGREPIDSPPNRCSADDGDEIVVDNDDESGRCQRESR